MGTAALPITGRTPAARQLPPQGPQSPGLFIPIRPEPSAPDPLDGRRTDLVIQRWRAQDDVRLPFELTIE